MAITLHNQTGYISQFVVKQGDLIIARLPGLEPDATLIVPLDDTRQVNASTVIDGNTYVSAPLEIRGSMGFLAQVLQVPSQGTYEFEVVESPSPVADQLSFQKTCLNPVTFTLTRDDKPLQNVVVSDSFRVETLNIGHTFSAYAIINGITTATVSTSNPNATISAVQDTSTLESGYFTLVVQ
ncbi:hypothetical protein HX867_07680 [Pseudomonas gingeri]|uniref:hypothetical protein n=1 Tax=Pseudomonas gingeri TaxID=117681 RepID=UPI0015A260C4|nr:hypothetical protein [Pseudomonas gingeri]NVZ61961.1 hypothetical protein [Pseudomonas gingeri]NVZ73961.1 hypothetical protein [Pseudomonas gingeri]